MNGIYNLFEKLKKLEDIRLVHIDEMLFKYDTQEVSDIWNTYVLQMCDILIDLNEFSQSLFKRYYDEYKKSERPESDLESKIKNTILLQIEINLLVDEYLSMIREAAIKENKDLFIELLFRNEKFSQFLIDLQLNSMLPKTYFNSVQDVLATKYKINQMSRIKFEFQVDDEEHLPLDRLLAKYHGSKMYELLERLELSWWWSDANLHQRVLQTSMILEGNTKFSTSLRHKHDFQICSFYYDNGIQAALKGMHKQSIKYFSMILELAQKNFDILSESGYDTPLIDAFEQLLYKVELLKILAELSSKFNLIGKKIITNEKMVILNTIDEIKKISNSYNPIIEIRYLSAMPGLYDAVASTLELLLSLDKEFDELSFEVSTRIQNFNTRLDVAANQLIQRIQNLKNKPTLEATKLSVISLREEIVILLEAASFIPVNIYERVASIRKLQMLDYLSRSIYEDIKAFELEDNNLIEVLIYKARANYYAELAIDLFHQQNDDSLPIDRIQVQYNGSLISGYMNQIEISQLNIQFLCVNDFLPNIFSIYSERKNLDEIRKIVTRDYGLSNLFLQIKNDCVRILQIKEILLDNKLSGINWDAIANKMGMVTGLIDFYNSLRTALLASHCSQEKIFGDSEIGFIKAKELAFNSSKILREVKTMEIQEFANHVFSFGQFCQDAANKVKQGQKVGLPIQEAVKLFRDMIFNI